ncbi:MAG: sigma-54 dependent transcriptional regulator [Planctomycetaceae bacterium]
MKSVLVVDDDRSVVSVIRGALAELDVEIESVTSAEDALQRLTGSSPDVMLLDFVLPKMSGLDALSFIRRTHPDLPVIFMTGSGDSDTTIAATKEGVQDYLLKPLDVQKVRSSVGLALSTPLPSSAGQKNGHILPLNHGASLVGRSPKMQAVLKSIGRVAEENVTVLVRGESGTGKELIAQAIWKHSRRTAKPFLAVNCAALSESLLESELFGHEKGAFTGADRQRIGKFEQCSGGTIFLDEIGDMARSVQARVLRLLQEQQFERVGGNSTINTDVRIIAATNCDLEQMCLTGRFREDLFHRLNGYTINLPPLRERNGDVVLLLEHFLWHYNQRLARTKKAIAPDAADILTSYSWPGNVRELQTVISKALLDATTPVITVQALPPSIRMSSAERRPPNATSATRRPADSEDNRAGNDVQGAGFTDVDRFIHRMITAQTDNLHANVLGYVERRLLLRVLNDANGNRSEAARVLSITRNSLRHKMNEYAISIDRSAVVCGDG